MKRTLLLLVALLFAACQTTPPKSCSDLIKEVTADHLKAGRVMVDAGSDGAGASLAVFWDMKSPMAYLEALVTQDYKLPEGHGLTLKGECTVPGAGGPDDQPSLLKYYSKQVPVSG